ncbi:hypothetical protein G7Z17_g8811 [Cylindrodendrum hubeiense]|uniref:Serine-rich protein n=1 Tax=Cylindrodendrum hubeiense TaxID=595255 RepID=A0A9P5L8P3_9HYPO|nr:hypothetical protein G7Z17_g8811 [Cylindrodendrum hubeiense]
MSASPSCTPPRRPLHERTSSQNNRLGIRLVPYSPPRIGADGSPSSRPISYADACTETDPEPWPRCSSPLAPSSFYYESPSPTVWTKIRPTATPDSRRTSRLATPESSSPWRPLTDVDDAEIDIHDDDSFQSAGELSPSQRPSSQSSSRPSSARRKIINVHSDKTFSVLPQDLSTSSRTDSIWSPPPSFSTRNSSYGRQSMGTFSDDHQDRPSSPLTPLTERSAVSKSPVSSSTQRVRSSPRVSPWNYRMIGGVRKVPKTPDLKQKQPQLSSAPSSVPPLPSLPEIELTNPIDVPSTRLLNEKLSFQSTVSSQSRSTLSDRTNYKIYGQSSPMAVAELDSLPASSIHSNYELLGGPSSTEPSVHVQTRPHTRESEANYVVHGGPSSASSVVAVRNRVKPEFSQESLIVPPLRPNKKRSWESFGLAKTRSHDSVRTGSLTSISTIMTQEATRALFVGPATMLHQVGPNWNPSTGAHSKPQPAVRPHQWSSQLSTVLSESEGGSEPASRALSVASFADRRSSSHSKHILSMVSSLAGLEEHTVGPSHSRRTSLEPPTAAYSRNALRDPNSGTIRLIRDHDEDGDGLAPLEELRHRPSRTRLGKMLSSYASDSQVYYGSGERKWLAYKPSSESMFSNFSFTDSQAGGLSRSPSQDRHISDIFSPRRRPRDPVAYHGGHRESDAGSMDITPLPPHPVLAVVRNLKKQTSSIWSPHLGRDRRAVRHSIWEPPSADWEARSELTGRRNAQVAMFVVGFIFPLAWMLAATIPIPLGIHDTEHGHSASKLSLRHGHGGQPQLVDDDMYRSAMWWRNVNRGMSIIGLLMLGAVIALIVVGTRQGWGT